jgi:hypothetical protein
MIRLIHTLIRAITSQSALLPGNIGFIHLSTPPTITTIISIYSITETNYEYEIDIIPG